MKYQQPELLKEGATIGIIAPSGAIRNKEAIELGIKRLKDMGFNIKLSAKLYEQKNYLAGEDKIRAGEIHRFFADDEVDCILCARGGYGAIRLLDLLDYELIKNNPKLFCGYSDISALSVMFLRHANLITYSSPMLSGDFGRDNLNEFTINTFMKVLGGKSITADLIGDDKITVSGIAWGGNLTTISSLCGRDFIPDKKFIFIIEDINEPTYKIDRALEMLYGIKEFRKNIIGMVSGDFTGVDNQTTLEEVLSEYTKKLNIPLWQGLKLGHEEEKITFGIGSNCKIEGNKIYFNKLLDE